MRNSQNGSSAFTGTEILAENGKCYRVDAATMMSAAERAQKYLEEAIRWSRERAVHLKSGAEEQNTRRHDQFLKRNHIPMDVWFPLENEFTQADLENVMAVLHHWTEGTLADFEAKYAWLEEALDLDPTYILFGVPIYQLSVGSQQELRRIGAAFAGRATAAAAALN
jgi:hypothetical protein